MQLNGQRGTHCECKCSGGEWVTEDQQGRVSVICFPLTFCFHFILCFFFLRLLVANQIMTSKSRDMYTVIEIL